jgi:flagellar biosynthesis protein FlhA
MIVSKGEIYIHKVLAINPGNAQNKLEGIETREPAYGLPAIWIEEQETLQAKKYGYTLVEPQALLITHFTETLKRESYKILTRLETEKLIERLKGTHLGLIEEIVPNVYSYSEIQSVLQELLKERVSIRQIELILEVLAQTSKQKREVFELVELVRQKLGAYIVEGLKDQQDTLNVLTIDPELERKLIQSVKQADGKRILLVDHKSVDSLMSSIARSCEKMMANNKLPVIICSNQLRKPLKNFVERIMPTITVLGLAEIPESINVKTFGSIQI